ncbi:MAG TPA: copper transporter, partial [Actinomycetota bacterium]|nr:copper transporter [Actinomycetota bacterium]
LLSTGFLRNRGPGLGSTALRELGGPRQVAVVVAGGAGDPAVEPGRFLVPLVQSLAARGGVVGAAESLSSNYAFVELVRSDAAVRSRVVTQDNVDQMPGEIAFVLALDALVESGRGGHYGVKDGADATAPPLS